ncbi:MAG: DUF4304 domain-containing protein [Bacteroidia bacterium]|nr:DUF4304 domain-containing protein [Bacteroidia bacterium]
MKDFIINKLNVFFLKNDFEGSIQKKTWYKVFRNVTLICNLQQSRYGDCFFINFGVFFNDLNRGIKTPKLSDCHLFGRIDRIIRNIYSKEYIADSYCFNFDLNEKETNMAIKILLEQIEKLIFPFFEEICDINFLKQNFPDNFNHDALWLQNISEFELINYLKNTI